MHLGAEHRKFETRILSRTTIEDIFKSIKNIPLHHIKDPIEFQKHISSRCRQQHLLSPVLFPRISVAPLAQGLNIEKNFDNSLLRLGSDWLKNAATITKSDLDIKSTPQNQLLPLDTVAFILNVSTYVVKKLIKQGILIAAIENNTNTKKISTLPKRTPRFIESHSLEKLQRALIKVNVSQANGKLVSFDHFGIDFASRLNLLTDLLKGNAEVVSYDPIVGLPSLKLRTFPNNQINTQKLSVKSAAKKLGIYPDAIYRLARAGFLRYSSYQTRQLLIDK